MKIRSNLMFGLLITSLFMLMGCSKVDKFTAPSGSTITVNPSAVDIASISADTIHNFTVTIYDAEGNPLNGAEVFIYGTFAAPRAIARYQFCRSIGGVDPVDAGFTGVTDSFGNYYFSIIVPAIVGGASNAFTDDINFNSGSAFASVTITLS